MVRVFSIGSDFSPKLREFRLLFYLSEVKNHYFEDVYAVVRTIPRGRVSTYGAIADYLTLGSARMVGWALRQLASFEMDVPAHRVVNAKGELTGRHMFRPPERMAHLLEAEGVSVIDDKVDNFKTLFWHPEEGI